MRLTLFLLIFILILPPAAGFCADGPPALALDDAIAIALERNHQLLAAGEEVEAARAVKGKALSAFLPKMDLSATWMRTDNPVMAFSSKLNQRRFSQTEFLIDNLNQPAGIDNWNYRAQLTQPVFNGGREITGYRQAALGVDASAQSYLRTRQDVVNQVVRAYWGVALAGEFVRTSEEAVDVTRAHVETARKFFDQGMLIGSEVLLAKVRLAETEEMLIKARNREKTAKAALNMLLSRPLGEDFTVSGLEQKEFAITLEDIQAEAIRNRPDLAVADIGVRIGEKGVTLAKGGYLPALNVVAHYDWDDRDPLRFRADSYTVSGMLSWNVFDGFGTAASVREARARLSAARHNAERMRDGMLFEALTAWNGLKEAEARIEVTEAAVSEAGEGLRILERRFQSGLARTLDVMDAQSALTRARTMRAQALHDHNVAVSAVKLAAGRMEW